MDGTGWGPVVWPDGSSHRLYDEEATTPRCTATPDCKGTMVAVDENTLRCSVCGGEVPIAPGESSEKG